MVKTNHDEERRRARRFQVGWDVAVKGTDRTGRSFNETAKLGNLSSVGAFFYLSKVVTVGERLELRIKVPLKKNNWMKYAAEVVRVTSRRANTEIAVKFDTAKPVFREG